MSLDTALVGDVDVSDDASDPDGASDPQATITAARTSSGPRLLCRSISAECLIRKLLSTTPIGRVRRYPATDDQWRRRRVVRSTTHATGLTLAETSVLAVPKIRVGISRSGKSPKVDPVQLRLSRN